MIARAARRDHAAEVSTATLDAVRAAGARLAAAEMPISIMALADEADVSQSVAWSARSRLRREGRWPWPDAPKGDAGTALAKGDEPTPDELAEIEARRAELRAEAVAEAARGLTPTRPWYCRDRDRPPVEALPPAEACASMLRDFRRRTGRRPATPAVPAATVTAADPEPEPQEPAMSRLNGLAEPPAAADAAPTCPDCGKPIGDRRKSTTCHCRVATGEAMATRPPRAAAPPTGAADPVLAELDAMKSLVRLLGPLDADGRRRVLAWATDRLTAGEVA